MTVDILTNVHVYYTMVTNDILSYEFYNKRCSALTSDILTVMNSTICEAEC